MKAPDRVTRVLRRWGVATQTRDGCVRLIHIKTGIELSVAWSPDIAEDLGWFHSKSVEVDFEDLVIGIIWNEVKKIDPELEILDLGPHKD